MLLKTPEDRRGEQKNAGNTKVPFLLLRPKEPAVRVFRSLPPPASPSIAETQKDVISDHHHDEGTYAGEEHARTAYSLSYIRGSGRLASSLTLLIHGILRSQESRRESVDVITYTKPSSCRSRRSERKDASTSARCYCCCTRASRPFSIPFHQPQPTISQTRRREVGK